MSSADSRVNSVLIVSTMTRLVGSDLQVFRWRVRVDETYVEQAGLVERRGGGPRVWEH
jgi:hypothetical protein